MLILAIETSGIGGSLALLRDGQVIETAQLDPQRRHARSLVPEIEAMFRHQDLKIDATDLFAISSGPGSFTGLRVGVTCVKTLGYVTGAPIAAIPTFHCLAEAAPSDVDRLQVVMNAQRGELFVGRYHRDDEEHWAETTPLGIESTANWIAKLGPEDVVTGPGLENIHRQIDARCRVLSSDLWNPQASIVGKLGARYFLEGRLTSCWELLPLYVRKSAAEEKWDARQLESTTLYPAANGQAGLPVVE